MSEKQVIPEVPKQEAPAATKVETLKTPRLKASERNKIIEDFKTGTLHPDYEIVTTKVANKYIFRARKVKLTEEQIEKVKQSVNDQPIKIEPSVEAPKKSREAKQ
jgi:hypothetical protein